MPESARLISLEKRFFLKERELNALLEITQSINQDSPEGALYKIFQFTLVGSSRVDLQACKLEYSIVSPK